MRQKNSDPLEKIQCSECGKDFGQKRYLKAHMKTHAENEQICCTLCDKVFTTKRGLDLHMESKHPTSDVISEDSIGFMILDTELTSNINIAINAIQSKSMETVTTKEPNVIEEKIEATNQCSVCEKSFLKKQYLKAHMKSHEPEEAVDPLEQFQCDVCDKQFEKKTHESKSKSKRRPMNLNLKRNLCNVIFVKISMQITVI